MEMKSELDDGYFCHICGDTGKVDRAYVQPHCGAIEGREQIQCPKCVEFKPKPLDAKPQKNKK